MMLEEITVTAQRRSENLQQVPVAVTALSMGAIDKADIHTPDDIATRIPSMTFSPFAPGQSVVSLRGISSNDDGAGTENSVAVFLDDVYLGRISNMAFEMFDVERIEVLRGPQGTLYGKNAIGGAINVVSTKPSDVFQAKVKAMVGNYNRKNFAGVLSGPLSDNLAAKVSFSTRNRDGWVQNIVTGHKLKNENVQSIRGQLMWTGNDTEIMLSGDSMDMDQSDMARIPTRSNGPLPGIAELHKSLGGDYKHSTNPQDGFARKKANGASMRIIHDFGEAGILTSITAYRDSNNEWEMDSTGAPSLNIVDEIADKTKQYSQEFRFAGDISDNMNYILGLFYMNENTDRQETFRLVFDADDRLPRLNAADTPDFVGSYRQDNTTNSFAGFANVNYNITDKLKLGAGVRYSYEEKDIDSWSAALSGPGFIVSANYGTNIFTKTGGVNAKESWSDLSPKVTLDYQITDNALIYASVAKGFKSGGFGAAPESAAAAVTPLKPETAWNYEIGTKSDMLDGTLRLNLAAFYTDYKDLQFQRFGHPIDGPINPFGVFRTRNAATAKIYGLEAEVTWVPVENLYISGNYSYMHTEAEFNFDAYYSTPPATPDIQTKPLTRAPKHKFAINLDYSHDLNMGGKLAYHIDYRYTGEQRGDVVSDLTLQPSWGVSDANISWTSEDEQWEFSVWGKNIFDEVYISHIYIVGPGDVAVYGDPRMYGVSATWRFN